MTSRTENRRLGDTFSTIDRRAGPQSMADGSSYGPLHWLTLSLVGAGDRVYVPSPRRKVSGTSQEYLP
jgi:hypothetical protein